MANIAITELGYKPTSITGKELKELLSKKLTDANTRLGYLQGLQSAYLTTSPRVMPSEELQTWRAKEFNIPPVFVYPYKALRMASDYQRDYGTAPVSDEPIYNQIYSTPKIDTDICCVTEQECIERAEFNSRASEIVDLLIETLIMQTAIETTKDNEKIDITVEGLAKLKS